jgi:hypothetical protein
VRVVIQQSDAYGTLLMLESVETTTTSWRSPLSTPTGGRGVTRSMPCCGDGACSPRRRWLFRRCRWVVAALILPGGLLLSVWVNYRSLEAVYVVRTTRLSADEGQRGVVAATVAATATAGGRAADASREDPHHGTLATAGHISNNDDGPGSLGRAPPPRPPPPPERVGTERAKPAAVLGVGEEESRILRRKPTLLLHVGLEKTGTTFLQCSLCSRNRVTEPILLQDNWIFLGTCPFAVRLVAL